MTALLLLAIHKDELDLAFTARYYKQGKAKSTYRLYLARHDGSARVALPGTPDGVMSFMWIDHNTLALVRDVEDKETEVYRYDLRTQKAKMIAKVAAFSYFERDKSGVETLDVDGKSFRVSDDKLVEVKNQSDEEPSFGKPVDDKADSSPWVGTVKLADKRTASLTFKPGYDNDDGEMDLAIALDGKSQSYRLKGLSVEWAYPAGENSIWVVTSVPFPKFNRASRLYRLDGLTGKKELLVDGVGHLQFDPKTPWWTATQAEGSPLTKLKDGRQVYTNWLYTGNWKTGQRWAVATGLVNVSRAAFRP